MSVPMMRSMLPPLDAVGEVGDLRSFSVSEDFLAVGFSPTHSGRSGSGFLERRTGGRIGNAGGGCPAPAAAAASAAITGWGPSMLTLRPYRCCDLGRGCLEVSDVAAVGGGIFTASAAVAAASFSVAGLDFFLCLI